MSPPERACNLAALYLAAGYRFRCAELLDAAMRMILAPPPRRAPAATP